MCNFARCQLFLLSKSFVNIACQGRVNSYNAFGDNLVNDLIPERELNVLICIVPLGTGR